MTHISLSPSAAALARLVREGGAYGYDELTSALGCHRNTLDRALRSLASAGALTYTGASAGRPSKSDGHAPLVVTVNPGNWVWVALDSVEVK